MLHDLIFFNGQETYVQRDSGRDKKETKINQEENFHPRVRINKVAVLHPYPAPMRFSSQTVAVQAVLLETGIYAIMDALKNKEDILSIT